MSSERKKFFEQESVKYAASFVFGLVLLGFSIGLVTELVTIAAVA